jgi:hypothetical protein
MTEILRQSPVSFKTGTVKTEERNFWPVVLEYENENTGQYLVDLSHVCRWDVQDSDLGKFKPAGVGIPSKPGESILSGEVLINRMNGTQASIWQFAKETPEFPNESAYTDTSEATVALAIMGDKVFSILEKLTSLDFLDPKKKTPVLLQGPMSHVPCQIVVLSKEEGKQGLLVSCSRGYAQSMVESLLHAGEEFELTPAGENLFMSWIELLNK